MKKDEILQLSGVLVFILYFLYSKFTIVLIQLLGIDYNILPMTFKVIYLLTIEFLFISIFYFIFRDKFNKDFIDYKKHFKEYTKKYLEYWAVAFGLMILSNLLIVTYLPDSVATNQQAIQEIFSKSPIYMIISAVIFAPIMEETVFRLSFRNIFKNDTVFIIISGLVFGSMHVIGSFTSIIDLIYVIPYSIPGFVFAYTLVKSKNIFVPMSLHFFHNTLMMILQIIMFMFI